MTGWPDQLAFIGQFADELRDQDSGVAKVFVSIACPKDAAPQPPPEVLVTLPGVAGFGAHAVAVSRRHSRCTSIDRNEDHGVHQG